MFSARRHWNSRGEQPIVLEYASRVSGPIPLHHRALTTAALMNKRKQDYLKSCIRVLPVFPPFDVRSSHLLWRRDSIGFLKISAVTRHMRCAGFSKTITKAYRTVVTIIILLLSITKHDEAPSMPLKSHLDSKLTAPQLLMFAGYTSVKSMS
jgi:hypothetical protein